jgi:hypothetical protein
MTLEPRSPPGVHPPVIAAAEPNLKVNRRPTDVHQQRASATARKKPGKIVHEFAGMLSTT